MVSYWLPRRLGCLHRLAAHEMEAPDTYRRRAEIADRAADAAADDEARRILKSVAQRWRQLAEIAQRELQEEESELSTAQHKTNHDY